MNLSLCYKNIFHAFFLVFLVSLVACGSNLNSSSETGSITFQLEWEQPLKTANAFNPPIPPLVKGGEGGFVITNGAKQSQNSVTSAAVSKICNDYGIETINAKVLTSSNVQKASGSWTCSLDPPQGTITGIPVGTNYTIRLEGTVSGGAVNWRGEKTGLSVSGGLTTNAGTITMTYIGDDTTPPTVSSTNPSNSVTNVPVTTTITATFSEVMASSSINTLTFTLKKNTTSVSGSVIYDSITMRAFFIPSSNLDYNTAYTATITTGVTDMAANHMTSNYTWSFTIESQPGSVPSAPTGVTTTAGDSQVTISWNAVNGATSYNIYWSTTSGVTKTNGTKISNVTSPYTHTGRTNSTTYYFVVTAVNNYGESVESKEVFATASKDIIITVYQPISNAFVGVNLNIIVSIKSLYEIKSVTAHVEGREASLSYSPDAICYLMHCNPGWVGNISLEGLARGETQLEITATDFFNNTVITTIPFIYDQQPSVVVVEPINYTVARPQLHINATCYDDDPAGCKTISAKVKVNDTIVATIATGQSSLDKTVSLSDYEGKSITLMFEAIDSANQTNFVERTVYIDSSTKLIEVETVGGPIWDVQPDSVLFMDSSNNKTVLKIRNRTSVLDTVVMDDATKVPVYGFLTSKGAIFVAYSGNVYNSAIYDWRDGVLNNLGRPDSTSSLKVKGDYAIWSKQFILALRDLVNGTNTEITGPWNDSIGNWQNDIAANGDVVYWTHSYEYNIYRYRGGVNTQLTNDRYDSGIWNTYPLTDGNGAVYRKHTPCCNNQTYSIVMYGNSGEVTLTEPRSQEPSPKLDYQINNGWIAFTRSGTGGQLQVWVRSPSGEETQITFFGSSSRINALGPNGEITFVHENRLYLGSPLSSYIDIGSSLGNSFYQNGQWFVIIGRSLFRVVP